VQGSSQIITTNKPTPAFHRSDALPVTQPIASKQWTEKYHIPWTWSPEAHPAVLQPLLWSLKAAVTSWKGYQTFRQPSDASTSFLTRGKPYIADGPFSSPFLRSWGAWILWSHTLKMPLSQMCLYDTRSNAVGTSRSVSKDIVWIWSLGCGMADPTRSMSLFCQRQRHGTWYSAAYRCAVALYNLGSGAADWHWL